VVPDVPDKQPDEEVPDANPEPPDHPTRRQMNKGWCSCSGAIFTWLLGTQSHLLVGLAEHHRLAHR